MFQVNCIEMKSKSNSKPRSSVEKIAESNFQYQQELEEDIRKLVNYLQEKSPNINHFEKY
jgi:Fe-S cluster assembly iron-binding protein IscA